MTGVITFNGSLVVYEFAYHEGQIKITDVRQLGSEPCMEINDELIAAIQADQARLAAKYA